MKLFHYLTLFLSTIRFWKRNFCQNLDLSFSHRTFKKRVLLVLLSIGLLVLINYRYLGSWLPGISRLPKSIQTSTSLDCFWPNDVNNNDKSVSSKQQAIGRVWPKPQQQTIGDKIFVLRPNTFQFQVFILKVCFTFDRNENKVFIFK